MDMRLSPATPKAPTEPLGGGIQALGPLADVRANTAASNPRVERFIAEAMKFEGQPYLWGGGHSDKTGVQRVDCSGLVLQAARMMGKGPDLDGTADDQSKMGKPVPMDQLQRGDLLFRSENGVAKHVGIYLGDGQFLHAPQSGEPVQIDSVAEYGRFTSARRIFDAPAPRGGGVPGDATSLGGNGRQSRLSLPR